MVTLAALDPLLVKRCPWPERLFGRVLAGVVILNGVVLALAAFLFLDKVGHEFHYVLPLSLAAGGWFINLQRFLLLLHGERRRRWSQFYSRMVCSLFMGFFAVLSFLSFYDYALHTEWGRPQLGYRYASVFLTALAAQFILPVYMRKRLFTGSMYSELERKEKALVIQRWNEEFSRNYTNLVRSDLGVSEYVMPKAMVFNVNE
jgi:hypothetical protein